MSKKIYYYAIGIVLMVGIAFLVFSEPKINGYTAQGDSNKQITVYKSPSCGCCVGYISELKKNRFNVNVIPTEDMDSIKKKYGIPASMESCHTAVLENYVIEGHVPIETVNTLLKEKPEIDGIALPGMPSGSAGMPGKKRMPFRVYALNDGRTKEYAVI